MRGLAASADGRAVPFLIVRLNDWVREVQVAARSALEGFLRPAFAANLISALPLIWALARQRRVDHRDIAARVLAFLQSPACAAAVRVGCSATDREIRRACFEIELAGGRRPSDSASRVALPAVFSDLPFAEALARAAVDRRWLLVDVTDAMNPASWAAAYTTWRDSEVIGWLEKYAVAIQVDARTDPETAFVLNIDPAAVPAVLLFRYGKERLRLRGRQHPRELLQQFVRIDVADDNLALARKMLKNPERDMRDRNQLADALLRAGLLDEALGHYHWLWQHMVEVDPEMSGVRVSFMASKVAELCDRLPAARARFAEHRDAAAALASTNDRAGLEACRDFVVLNDAIDDDESTLAWLDGLDSDRRRALPDGVVVFHLLPLLYERERWQDAGGLIREPLQDLETILERAKELGDTRERDHAAYRRHLIAEGRLAEAKDTRRLSRGLYCDVAALHRSLVAAGRDQIAAEVRDAALRFEDSAAMRGAFQ